MRNNIELDSSGGIGKGSVLPAHENSYHGMLFIWLEDNLKEPKLMQYNAILRKWKPVGGNSQGVNGGCFIIDVTPTNTGNVGNKVYDEDGVVLRSFVTDTTKVKVKILSVTGNTRYNGKVTLNETPVTMIPQSDKPLFEGFIDVDLIGQTSLIALHEDGAKCETTFVIEDIPRITSVNFLGDYPNGQTELKENDEIKINIKADTPITKVEIADYGACKSKIINANGTLVDIITSIANRGNMSQLLPVKCRVQKATGSWSDWFISNSTGSLEKVNVVKLNNTYPTINIVDVVYPNGQQALKDNEQTTIFHNITNYSTVTYSSPTNELSINNTELFETNKTVSRVSGGYNISNNNFKIVAKRNENGATNTVEKVINIAHDEPIITIQEQTERLISSGTGYNSWIKLISNQKLLETPKLILEQGVWLNEFETTDDITWKRTIVINDSVPKGNYSYLSMTAKSLSGKTITMITGDKGYIIGGFATRKVTFKPFEAIALIGCHVSDITKLSVVDLSGYILNYQNSLNDNSLSYTITDELGNINPNGNYIRLTSSSIINANSTGTYYVNISERA